MKIRKRRLGILTRMAALTTVLCAIISVQSLHAASTILVTSTADDGSAGTLRGALASAADGDTIDATGISGTITLLPHLLTSSQLAVTKSLIILGPGAGNLTIDGNQTSRVFLIFSGHTVTIDGFTMANGRASGAPPGSFPPSSGGGIYNDHSNVTVRNCTISGNYAEIDGGGICNDGSSSGAASLIVDRCTLSFNSSAKGSGGIANLADIGLGLGTATADIGASALIGNSGGVGGAIVNVRGTLTVTNTTLSANSAFDFAGGIEISGGNVTVLNSTLSGNASFLVGSTIHISSGRLQIGSSIIKKAGSSAITMFAEVSGGLISLGNNLSTDAPPYHITQPTDQTNTDPMLGPVADNGGPTRTHLPLPGSPAIDKGSSDGLVAFGITTDQRGFARTVDDPGIVNAFAGDGTDIGAVEVPAAPPPPPPAPVADVSVTFEGVDKTSVKQGEQLTYTLSVRNFGPNAAANVVVNDLLSSGTGFLSARATKGNFTAPPVNETGVVAWTLPQLANGGAEGAQLVIKVIVKGKTTVTSIATVNSDAQDPDPENNVDAITTPVAAGGNSGGGGKKK